MIILTLDKHALVKAGSSIRDTVNTTLDDSTWGHHTPQKGGLKQH
jgi:hypothetical protein